MRRIISLWFPNLPIDRLRRPANAGGPGEGKHPLVLTTECAGRVVVTAVDAAASAAGVAPGMALADARALLPRIATAAADPQADAAVLDGLAVWCGRYTPWTAPEGCDGVWLDVSGCAHLFGGERAMLDDLLARLDGFGLRARAALADTPGAAWALARYGANRAIVSSGAYRPSDCLRPSAEAYRPSDCLRPSVGAYRPSDSVRPDAAATREALAGLPVAALRLGPAAVDGLTRLGLRRIGDLYALPRAPLAARFGGEVARRLDQALGREAEPVSPRRPVPRHRVRLSFPEPIGLRDDIAAALGRLLGALCEKLNQAGRGCRRLDLTCYRADGSLQAVAVGTAAPARDAAHLARLFAERLDTIDPGFGVESMVLSASHTEPLAAAQVQASCSPQGDRPLKKASSSPQGDRPTKESLSPLLDRLGNRFGFAQVAQLRAHESHLPERACQLAPATGAADRADWRYPMPRPLRLLGHPEPVEAVSPLSGDAPLRAFLWRRVRHRVRAAEGPERIVPEWWRADPAWAGGARDYWRIEDAAGQRFWLFRDDKSRWFLHGLFA
jgi:protein ImuB